MHWITLLVLVSNLWISTRGQTNGNQTAENEVVQTCKCMKYWKCLDEGGIIYSSCGLVNICCLFGKNADKEDLLPFSKQLTSRTIKKKLPTSSAAAKPKKRTAKKILKSNNNNNFESILNNRLTNQSRSSRRKPTLNKNENTLFCGRQGEKGELYHWHVDILEKRHNLYICGGSLISNQHILTAAHCFESRNSASVLKVRLGDYDISRDDESDLPFEEISVRKITVHPNFSPVTLNNDIAILQLDKPVKTNPIIQKICLPTPDVIKIMEINVDKLSCFVVGHGKLNETSKNYSLTVKTIKVPLWTKPRCEKALKRLFDADNNLPSMSSILCAGSINKDACIGDGGSSMACQISGSKTFYQLGIVSFGVGCGRSNSIPGIYAFVGDKINWIKSSLK